MRLARTSLFFLLFLPLSLSLQGCKPEGGPGGYGGMPPPAVDVAQPLKRKVVDQKEFVGRFEAPAQVDLRARVTGYLTEVHFQDGQQVTEGEVLFTIDPRPFEYDLQQAQASFTQAENEFKRGEMLRKSRAISEEDFDRRAQELKVAQADLDNAKLDLEFSSVTAPISGKVSDAFVDIGNLVVADNTMLTRIVNSNPIHFAFDVPQGDFLNYQRLVRGDNSPDSFAIKIRLNDEKEFTHEGVLDFVDNILDAGTGTISARAVVSNPTGLIVPGLFGRARLSVSGEYDALLIPERALNSDQDKKFVLTVNEQNQAQRAYVELGPVQDDGMIVIRSGLKEDDRVIVAGVQFIRAPNQPVQPNVVSLEKADQKSSQNAGQFN